MSYEEILEEAGSLAQGGEIDQAVSLYQVALEAEPSRVEGYAQLALLQYSQNHLMEAEELFEKAAALTPSDASFLNNLGVMQYRQGKLEQARKTLENALATDLNYVDAAVNLRKVRLDLIQQRIERAFSEYSLGRFHHLTSFIYKLKTEYLKATKLSTPVAARIRRQRNSVPIQDGRREILFLSLNPRVDMAKKADALARTGRYRVIMLCSEKTAGVVGGFFHQFFDEVITYSDLIELVCFLLALDPDVIVARPKVTAPAIIFGNAPVVYNSYDIYSFTRPKEYADPFEMEGEQFRFENADAIIHKGQEDEIDLCLRPRYDINAPVLHFHPCCWKRYFVPQNLPRLSQMDGELHIVYTGLVEPPSTDKRLNGEVHFLDTARLITAQGLHFHIYYSPQLGRSDDYYREYFELAEQNDRFHFHSGLGYEELCSEIARYDYGWNVLDYRYTVMPELWHKMVSTNKIFTYLEAGLPMIVGSKNEYIASFVQKQGIGIDMDWYDLQSLSERLGDVDYDRLKANVFRAREGFSIDNHIHKLEGLFETAHRRWMERRHE